MERFGAIKINKSANQIQSLCRLCGMHNPGMTVICEELETDVVDLDDDPSLQRKIEACIGILVMPNDHLPQHCCGICTDKICDFFEFRLMCTSTDIQTRRLLGLPPRTEIKPIVKEEPPVLMPSLVAGPKSKSRFLQPAQIKIEEPVLMEIAPPPDVLEETRRQASKKKKGQLEPVIPLKRIKIESEEISCTVCKESFTSEGDKYAHVYNAHVPAPSKYGCSSCGNGFTQYEWKQHRAWHIKRKKPYVCFRCGEKFDVYTLFSKHFHNNKCSYPLEVMQPDIQCELCRKRFATRNLYEWHTCFIKNKTNCRKCGQYFSNKHKLFTHFIICPLPFIDIVQKKPAEGTSKVKITSKRMVDIETDESSIKTEVDLDISALLETSIHETDKEEPCPAKISSLLESVNDAIDKISEERNKRRRGRPTNRSNKKVTPLKLVLKPNIGTTNDKDEDDDDLEHIPAEEHFGEVDSGDDDDDTTSQTTNTETSGSATPALRIKLEKLDVAYGDAVTAEKEPAVEGTLQDLIRNIKKEPGVHTQEELAAVVREHNPVKKIKKTINPLALRHKKKKSLSRHTLIMKIKKERSENDQPNEDPPTSDKEPQTTPIKRALNPIAAAAAKRHRITAKLALKIKKEKSKKKNKAPEVSGNIVPNVRIKQEEPDSDEEHHEGPIETDYLGINPLSLLRHKALQKTKQTSATGDPNGVEGATAAPTDPTPVEEKTTTENQPSVGTETPEKPSEEPSKEPPTETPPMVSLNPNPMASFFSAKKTGGFMKLSLNSGGLNFGSAATKKSSPVQMPVIANIVSGVDASFHDLDKDTEKTKVDKDTEKTKDDKDTENTKDQSIQESEKIEEPSPQTQTSEPSQPESTPIVTEKPPEVAPVVNKPKLGGFMKISGTTGGFLQFPGITRSPVEPKIPPVESSSNDAVKIIEDTNTSSQVSAEVKTTAPSPATPSIIPGFSLSSGFKKLSAFSLPNTSTTNHETTSTSSNLTFPTNTTEGIQMPIINNISTLDLDDLISSPPQPEIDMESLLNEKLLDEEKRDNCDNGTDDFLKQIDEQLLDT